MHWVSHTNTHTNQCTLPLWSIHASMDYSHGAQITDAGPVPAIIFFWHKWAQKKPTVSWRINSSSHPPITVIVTGRRPSFMKTACQSFFPPTTHTDDKNIHTHTQRHTYAVYLHIHYSSTSDQLSCWIPNRTYPINPSHAGIKDWYWGRGTTSTLHHNQAC